MHTSAFTVQKKARMCKPVRSNRFSNSSLEKLQNRILNDISNMHGYPQMSQKH